ncbi:MAG TPA: MarR family transcriptional regulator [Acidimicrobiales bacterium]|nr:MarR family transcriptional regulator [Acidimicrobiales bacterium]
MSRAPMRRGFSSSDEADLIRAEQDVQARIGDLEVDFVSMAAVANVFRVASAARSHLERSVLAPLDLSFSAFTVLWVLWVWGEQESRHLAAEAGITKGTLTGVVSTLEGRGLVERRPHADDRRLVLVRATAKGRRTMRTLFPRFNGEEQQIVAGLSVAERRDLAHLLRQVLRTLEGLEVESDGSEQPAAARE